MAHAINKIVGENVKRLRKLVKLNQQEFAFKIDRTRATVINLEAGRAATTLESLLRICKVLECTPNDLLPLEYEFKLKPLNQYEAIKLNEKGKRLQAQLDAVRAQQKLLTTSPAHQGRETKKG